MNQVTKISSLDQLFIAFKRSSENDFDKCKKMVVKDDQMKAKGDKKNDKKNLQ